MAADGVHVEPGSVYQEPATVCGLECLITGMPVDRPEPHLVKDVVFDALDDFFITNVVGLCRETSEFGLYAENPISDAAHFPILRLYVGTETTGSGCNI